MKKINIKYIALCCSILTALTACNKIDEINNTKADVLSEDAIRVEIPKNTFYNEVQVHSVISNNFGKYEDFLIPTDYSTGIVSAKHGAANSEHIYMFDSSEEPTSSTKSGAKAEKFDIMVNGVPVKNNTKAGGINLESYFGTTVKFSIAPRTKAESDSDGQSEIYVPEKIMISAPDLAEIDYKSPLCYYKNFVLKWNMDEKNKNGVIVAVEWNGNMVYGDSAENTYVRRMDCVPDNGECVLNEKLFEDIPDTALCNLYLARGDMDNVLVNGYSYKISGITFAAFQFILVREIVAK